MEPGKKAEDKFIIYSQVAKTLKKIMGDDICHSHWTLHEREVIVSALTGNDSCKWSIGMDLWYTVVITFSRKVSRYQSVNQNTVNQRKTDKTMTRRFDWFWILVF